jgi:zinc transport system ATP-binding protein
VQHRPVVEIRDVSIFRDARPVVSDVALDVAAGSVHLLVGPNGAGKSTLFAALLGLIAFTGSIRFHWQQSGRIGYVPQTFNVDRTLPVTVGEFLALSRQRRPVCLGIPHALQTRLQRVLDQVGLSGFWSRPLGALSGGELQRVLLANAIHPVPELLLLDEPASGLDEMGIAQFEEVVVALKRTAGASVLMVSHDLGQVRRVADHVTLIDRTVRRSGVPGDVLLHDLAGSLGLNSGYAAP